MKEAKQILSRSLLKWRFLRISEVLLCSLGVAFLIYFALGKVWIALIAFCATVLLASFYFKPWKYNMQSICSDIDSKLSPMENSTSLLLESAQELSILAKIQQEKTANRLQKHKKEIRFKNKLVLCFSIALLGLGLGLALHYSGWSQNQSVVNNSNLKEEIIQFQPIDSIITNVIPPKIISQTAIVNFPGYTGKASVKSTNMNLTLLEGSSVTWKLQFDQKIEQALHQFGEESSPMKLKNQYYTQFKKAKHSQFYSIKFTDTLNNGYVSDLYAFEVQKDQPPQLKIDGVPQFSTFQYDSPQLLNFTTLVKDDYGVSDVAIIATVSKGTGESVKFREERLSFDNSFTKYSKNSSLQKRIDLHSLKMEPGDELYFYVEAVDNKDPSPNISRTQTYFSVIEDTVTSRFAVEGTMGADLMPDYFRSQRQLIIDTEKLIADRSKLTKKEFNAISNELGYDQKALRIKYGAFMGDESDNSLATQTVEENLDSDDPLGAYSHKHDGDNEHNLVAEAQHDHENETAKGDSDKDDPLEAYVHNHENPEASTLFAKSLKQKLKDAMQEMWDAELHLRLFEPKKSLPFQYKALKLVQEIKNSARIYVHRIGFDPPPIKEDKRLSGKIDEIKNYTKKDKLKTTDPFNAARLAISILELAITDNYVFTNKDAIIFKDAGNEMVEMALNEPGKHLETVQGLKWLSEGRQISIEQLKIVQGRLQNSLPKKGPSPNVENLATNKINELFLEKLDVN